MARGWESKDVEQQMESRAERREQPRLTPEEAERERRIAHLDLERRGILEQLSRAKHPRHRQQLEQALQHVERLLNDARGQ